VIAAAAHRLLVGLLNTGLDQLLDAPSFTMESTAAELEEGAHLLALQLGLLQGSRFPDDRNWMLIDHERMTLVAAKWSPIGAWEHVEIQLNRCDGDKGFSHWQVLVTQRRSTDDSPEHWSDKAAYVSNQTYTNPADIKLAVDEAFERLDLRQFGQNGVWTHAAILASQAAWKIRRDLDAAEDADALYEELHDIGTAQPADANLSLCLLGVVNAWWSDDKDLCMAAALLVERLLNPVETP
jgi:hypothetical protein